jgi:hypothetical protein
MRSERFSRRVLSGFADPSSLAELIRRGGGAISSQHGIVDVNRSRMSATLRPIAGRFVRGLRLDDGTWLTQCIKQGR